MGRIERLGEDLVNKIAAGEVVERPASVVKELVENSLDAGASSVRIEIEGGGKSLIRVRDDGVGMDREDAERALERHATSKLRRLEDLERLHTHGFRGEALPSISSVSHLLLQTRDTSAPAGTEVEVRHGDLLHVRDAGHPRGTTVEVRDLFGAVPARRKFLRADPTEASHVAEVVTLLSLARPEAGFTLLSGGRSLIAAPPVSDLRARTYQLFGSELLDDLLDVDGGEGWARVRGLVSRPDRPPRGRGGLRLYVNGRPVRDRALSKALAEGYRSAGKGEPRAEAILFVEVPTHLVDVNVHPAKTEVRFADGRAVFWAVEKSVREALSSGARASLPKADTAGLSSWHEAESVRESPPSSAHRSLVDATPSAPEWDVLGQHRRTYILATDGEDLILVDQHTAHERVRFEALSRLLSDGRPESQRLLLPAVQELPPSLFPLVEEHAGALALLGFDVEPFGGSAVRILAVPAVLGSREAGPALESLLRDVTERGGSWEVEGSEKLTATLACHSAVRAGETLTAQGMAQILKDLRSTAHPTLCPHGRPTSVRIPRDEVSRWFGRTGWRRQ